MASKRVMDEFFILMGMFTMESGRMTELMGLEYSKTQPEHDTKGNGKWISNMAKARRFLRKKGQFMKESFMKDRNQVRELSNGEMEAITRESSLMESMKVKDSTTLPTKVGSTKESL